MLCAVKVIRARIEVNGAQESAGILHDTHVFGE